MENYNISIDLMKLNNTFVQDFTSRSGITKRCICIPIEDNNITFYQRNNGNNSLYFPLAMWKKKDGQDGYGKTHYLKPSIKGENIPIIGDAKPIIPKNPTPPQTQQNDWQPATYQTPIQPPQAPPQVQYMQQSLGGTIEQFPLQEEPDLPF